MLSMKAKYALRALIVLAGKNRGVMQLKTVAQEADVPYKFLEHIMQELKANGVVNSKRGVFGGYFLARESNEIAVGEIIRFIDGPLAPVRCASLTAYQRCDDCVDEHTCSIRKVMLKVRNAIADVLDNCSLSELTASDNKRLEFLNYCI